MTLASPTDHAFVGGFRLTDDSLLDIIDVYLVDRDSSKITIVIV